MSDANILINWLDFWGVSKNKVVDNERFNNLSRNLLNSNFNDSFKNPKKF
jgi:hypothetical protein